MSIVEKQSRLLEECLDSVKQWNELINKHISSEEKVGFQKSVKDITTSYALVQFEAQKQDDALKRIENHMEELGDNEPPDVDAMFQSLIAQNTSEFNLEESDVWDMVFRGQDVQEIVHKRSSSLNESRYEQLEDSIMCSEVFKVPVDPLTKRNITEPCRNKHCKHVYEYASILGYIKTMKRKAKCPYVGCNNQELRAVDLVKDEELQEKILSFTTNRTNHSEDE